MTQSPSPVPERHSLRAKAEAGAQAVVGRQVGHHRTDRVGRLRAAVLGTNRRHRLDREPDAWRRGRELEPEPHRADAMAMGITAGAGALFAGVSPSG